MARARKPQGLFTLNRDSPQAVALLGVWGRLVGGDHWHDYSFQSNNDALLRNIPSPYANSGFAGGVDGGSRAFLFKGSASTSAFAVRPTAMTTAGYSISLWAKWTTTGTLATDIQNLFDNNHAAGQGFTLQDRPDAGNVLSFYTGNTDVQTATQIGDGQWHHICGTYDGDRSSLYVDGKRLATATGVTAGTMTTNVTWGCWQFSGGQRFLTGTLEDPRIYGKALTDIDVWRMVDPRTRWDLQWVAPRRIYSFSPGGVAPPPPPPPDNFLFDQMRRDEGEDVPEFDPSDADPMWWNAATLSAPAAVVPDPTVTSVPVTKMKFDFDEKQTEIRSRRHQQQVSKMLNNLVRTGQLQNTFDDPVLGYFPTDTTDWTTSPTTIQDALDQLAAPGTAVGDLAGGATLSDTIAKLNALLAALRAKKTIGS